MARRKYKYKVPRERTPHKDVIKAYRKRNNLKVKTFSLEPVLATEFEDAVKKMNRTQIDVIRELMRTYIEKVNNLEVKS